MSKNMGTIVMIAVIFAVTIIGSLILKNRMDAWEKKAENVQKEETVKEEKIVSPIEGAEDYYKKAGKISIEKVERRSENDGDGNSKTEYRSYIVSDVDLSEGHDNTAEYANALKEDEFDDSGVRKMKFTEAFDFSYEGMDAWDIYNRILSDNGFDGDLESAHLDEEEQKLSKRMIYDLKSSSILDMLCLDEKYDSIVSKKAYFQVEEIGEAKVPQSFTAEVVFAKGDKTITKSFYLQMVVEDEEGEVVDNE